MGSGPYRLHVAVDRGTGPVYVLLHGINSTGHDWDTVVTAMGFDRRCIAVDELGYGRSPKPLDIEYTIDEHVESLRYTLREIGVDEPFTIVGYSMGGPIALRYAATYREEVERLILISAPFFLRPEEMGSDAYAKAVFQSEGSHSLLNMVTSAGFAESGVFRTLSSEERQVIQGFINAQDLKTDWQILQKNMNNVIQGSDFPADLVRVKAPITFMVGEHDTFIVQSQIETLRENYAPNMEIRYLADLKADHMLLENVPVMMAAEITRWEDRRLAVALDRGEGDVYVLLHGVENDGSYWNEVGAALATKNRAISLDLLGFGLSPRPLDIPYSAANQIASIEETLEALLGEGARFTLVGHSLGALLSAAYAVRHPEQVERLVLFSTPINIREISAADGTLHQARAAFVDNFGALRQRGAALSRKRAVRGVLGHERLDRYEPSLRSIKNVIEKESLAEQLALLAMPVTVVHGSRDPFVVPEYVSALSEVREGIEVVTLDAGHNVATEKPLESVAAIDPSVDADQAAAVIEKSKTDRKLRPSTVGLAQAYSADSILVGLRGLLYVAYGALLLMSPPQGDLRLLRVGFVVVLFARSVATITGTFTTRSIRQERLTSAVSGIVGIVLGVFLMVSTQLATLTIGLWVAGYLFYTGAVNVFAGLRTSHAARRRRRLLFEGSAEIVAALLLLGGSVFIARAFVTVVMVASIGAGVSLLSFAIVSRRTGRTLADPRLG